MSSGRLDFNAVDGANKVKPISAYSNVLYSSIELELKFNSKLPMISRLKKELDDFYHKAFEIHLLLLKNEALTNKEKLNFCRIERNYIKLYLRAIMKKHLI